MCNSVTHVQFDSPFDRDAHWTVLGCFAPSGEREDIWGGIRVCWGQGERLRSELKPRWIATAASEPTIDHYTV